MLSHKTRYALKALMMLADDQKAGGEDVEGGQRLFVGIQRIGVIE